MASVSGVTTQKDSQGNITHITIDVKKPGNCAGATGIGAVGKSQFDKDFEKGISVDEFIEMLPWKD